MANRMSIRGQGGLLWRLLPIVRVAFASVGRGWNRFYAWMLDRQERNNTIDRILARQVDAPDKDRGLYDISRGVHHADYLRRHGLEPHHVLLDFGCGFGRTAIPLLPYLEPDCYIGVELSAERIRLAEEWVVKEALGDRRPRWIVSMDTSMPYLDDATVDVIWANSVFTHMPLEETKNVLAAAWRVLRPGGCFLFNFAVSADGAVHNSNIKDYQYPPDLMQECVKQYGFTAAVLDDWQDDLPEENRAKHNMMLKITKPSAD